MKTQVLTPRPVEEIRLELDERYKSKAFDFVCPTDKDIPQHVVFYESGLNGLLLGIAESELEIVEGVSYDKFASRVTRPGQLAINGIINAVGDLHQADYIQNYLTELYGVDLAGKRKALRSVYSQIPNSAPAGNIEFADLVARGEIAINL